MPREPRHFPDEIHRAFARRVRALRLERELSQAELAERMTLLGVPMDRTAIARIEQAAIESEAKLKPRRVSISEAAGFAEAFIVPLAAVLPYDVSAYDYSEPLTRAHFDTRMDVLMTEVAPEVAPVNPTTVLHESKKRQLKRRDPFLAYIGQYPELQRAYDQALADDPAKAERIRARWYEQQVTNPPREPYEDAVERVFGKPPGTKRIRMTGNDPKLDYTAVKGSSGSPVKRGSKRRRKQ